MMKRKNSGFTLIEMLAAIVIIVLLVVGIGAGMRAASKSYTKSIYQSNCGTLSDILNTSVSDILRYSESVSGEGTDFTFTNKDYYVKDCSFAISSIEGKSGGYLVLRCVDKNGQATDTPLVNDGAYAGDLMLTAFTVTSHKVPNNTGYYFDVSYTIQSVSDATLSDSYSIRVRQINADLPTDFNTQSDSDNDDDDNDEPTVDADAITVVYYQNTVDGESPVFTDVFGNSSRSITQMVYPNESLSFTSYNGDVSRAWYTFKGWNTSSTGSGTHYSAGEKITFTEDQAKQLGGNEFPLYAEWEEATYTIVYDPNGGKIISESSSTVTQTFTKQHPTVTLDSGNDFAKTGNKVTFNANSGTLVDSDTQVKASCALEGWSVSATGGTAYTPGQSIDATTIDGFNPKAEKLTLYAKWSTAKVKLPTATKKSWTLKGWNTAKKSKSGTKAGTEVTISKDVTYYAHYYIKAKFYINDGVTKDPVTTLTHWYGYDDDITLPAALTRTGYDFDGWYTKAIGGTKIGTTDDLLTQLGKASPTYKFYAQWVPAKVTISYDGNIGSGTLTGATADSTGDYGGTVTLNSNGFTKYYTMTYKYIINGTTNELSGLTEKQTKQLLTFKGWTTAKEADYKNSLGEENDTAVRYQPGEYRVSNFIDETSEGPYNATLYARWYYSGNVTYPTKAELGSALNGWNLDGWNQSSTSTNPNQVGKTTQMLSANTTIYAVLSRTITYNANGGTVNSKSTDTAKYFSTKSAPALPTPDARTGYTFAGWYTAANGGTQITDLSKATYGTNGTLNLYAHWTIKSYTVSYSVTVNAYTLPNGTKVSNPTYTVPTGGSYNYNTSLSVASAYSAQTVKDSSGREMGTWSFSGWSKTGNFNVTSNTSITGSWTFTPKKYTVSFDTKGHGTAPTSQSVVYGSTASKPSDLSVTGYEFGGWYTDTNCTVAYNFNTAITGNLTLYAKWTALYRYLVKFDDGDGGDTTYPASGLPSNADSGWVTGKSSYTKSFTLPTRNGYTFNGWTVTVKTNGATASVSSDKKSVSVNGVAGSTTEVLLTAKWTANSYKISVVTDNGATCSVNSSATTKSTVYFTPSDSDGIYAVYVYNTSGGSKDNAFKTINPATSGTKYSFTMPAKDVTIYVNGCKTLRNITITGYTNNYISSLTVDDVTCGKNGVTQAHEGDTVRVNVNSIKAGQLFMSFVFRTSNTNEYVCSSFYNYDDYSANQSYTFTMPAYDVTVAAYGGAKYGDYDYNDLTGENVRNDTTRESTCYWLDFGHSGCDNKLHKLKIQSWKKWENALNYFHIKVYYADTGYVLISDRRLDWTTPNKDKIIRDCYIFKR